MATQFILAPFGKKKRGKPWFFHVPIPKRGNWISDALLERKCLDILSIIYGAATKEFNFRQFAWESPDVSLYEFRGQGVDLPWLLTARDLAPRFGWTAQGFERRAAQKGVPFILRKWGSERLYMRGLVQAMMIDSITRPAVGEKAPFNARLNSVIEKCTQEKKRRSALAA
jgi:hypothetical protein